MFFLRLMYFDLEIKIWCPFPSAGTEKNNNLEKMIISRLQRVLEYNSKNQVLLSNYWSIIMYYYLLLRKGGDWLIFVYKTKSLVGTIITPIASSIERSETVNALGESNRSHCQSTTRKPLACFRIWYSQ